MLAQTMLQDAWDAICIFADMPELAIDPRMNTPAKRLGEGITEQDSREVREALTEAFARKTAAEWDEFLRTQPEAIWERVRNWDEVLEDEQSVVNGYVVSIDVPGFGPTKTVGNLVTLSETPGSVKGGPPVLGEGNAEILAEVGMTAGEIEEIGARATSVRDEAFALIFEAQKQQ
jgi:crotonobetainyl-CoA:carnitine CoA-transferase CaiB-like acyl-CoA transferase